MRMGIWIRSRILLRIPVAKFMGKLPVIGIKVGDHVCMLCINDDIRMYGYG